MANPCIQEARLMNIEKDTEKVSQAIFGNGEPGMKDSIAVINERVSTITRMLWLILGTVMTAVVMAGMNMILHHTATAATVTQSLGK